MASKFLDHTYRHLDVERLISSLKLLAARIRDRFPLAGLARVCEELITITEENSTRVTTIGRRDWWLWTGVLVLLTAGAGGFTLLFRLIDFRKTNADNVFTVIQGIDAMMNIVVLMGGALFFLMTMEDRLKRRRAIRAINELRSLIHVVDMHQLTKEPASLLAGGAPTPNSPARGLTPFQLGRYLDYCSEMLALIAKVAVLYAQAMPDPVVVDAVSDIERLTSNLQQKIWLKITLVHSVSGGLDPDDTSYDVQDETGGPQFTANEET